MKTWAIRVIGTQKYMPYGRGSFSFDEPQDIQFKPPRLFKSKRGAQNALTAWLCGRIIVQSIPSVYDVFNGDYNGGEISKHFKKVESRQRKDMEIVEFDLVEVK